MNRYVLQGDVVLQRAIMPPGGSFMDSVKTVPSFVGVRV